MLTAALAVRAEPGTNLQAMSLKSLGSNGSDDVNAIIYAIGLVIVAAVWALP